MRMSCNGCRILRKGCSDDCTIKPCLEWIKSSDSQANATLFLAKFYGRAGLINLIEAGPPHLRPAIFRSLLYEACGRIVDPISGSVGLLWSGKWAQCQAAVEAVLKGKPIKQNPSSPSSSSSTVTTTTTSSSGAPAFNPIIPPLKIYDIRHVYKEPTSEINKTGRFKRSWNRRPKGPLASDHQSTSQLIETLSHDSWLGQLGNNAESSNETVEGSMMNMCQRQWGWNSVGRKENSEVGLELTLGLASSNELVKEQQVELEN